MSEEIPLPLRMMFDQMAGPLLEQSPPELLRYLREKIDRQLEELEQTIDSTATDE